jgi:fatty acid desaturase
MPTHTIDRETLRTLSVPSNVKGFWDFLLVWGVIAICFAIALIVDRWYAYLLAIVVIGGRQNALATLAHEGWHGLLFSSRRMNRFAGAWLYAYPIGILYDHDRERHLRHHREVGHDYDPDWINYTSDHRDTPVRVLGYLSSLLFGRLLFASLLSFVSRGRPRIGVEPTGDEEREPHSGALRELTDALLCQAMLFTVMMLVSHRWWSYPLLWLLPLATFAGFFANFRAFMEHVTVRDDVAPENRLRDTLAGPMERFFVAPSHFNYHALHHAHPSIPHYNLCRGKNEYMNQLGFYPFSVRRGYLAAFFDHMKELRKQA